MHQPFLNVLKGAEGKGLTFTFMSDSTCSLRLLKKDIQSNISSGLSLGYSWKNFIVLGEQFS